MSIETNLNISPYYDDYDPNKNYYKILFRPGVSLQARELTQMQDILQNQITKFGDHIFKSGTIISGVNFQFLPNYSYVKLADSQVDGQPTLTEGYVGLNAKNSSNVVAEVINYKSGYLSTDPETNYIYLNYINSGSDSNTTTFTNNDVLTIYDQNYTLFDFTVNNGGSSGFANTESVEIISALLVNNSNVAAGATIYQNYGANTANVYVIESNNTFGQIFVNDAYYDSNDGYSILKIKPIASDLSNIDTLTTERWNVRAGLNVTQINNVNTAYVVAKIGSGASAVLTTDSQGIVKDVSLVNGGTGYIVSPHVTVASKNGTINSLNITALNYKAQVYVANSSYSANGTTPVGNAYAFAVSSGVIYQKGYFLQVNNQTIIVNAYSSNVDSVTVGFVSAETIVNSNSDDTLLDNSIGTPNYTAPGANRLQINPELAVINASNVSSNNTFFPLVDFRNGGPYKQNRTTVYGEISKEFERRTFETSGSFIIDPFVVSTKDQPVFSNTHINVVVDPGLAYINGKRIETQRNTFIPLRRSNDYQVVTNQVLGLNYGSYVYVDNLSGVFPFKVGELVVFYDTPNKQYTSNSNTISPSGNSVGYARIRSLVLDSGIAGTTGSRYRMYLFDINMNPGKSFARDAKSIYYNGPTIDAICDILSSISGTTNEQLSVVQDNNRNGLIFRNGNRATRNSNSFVYQYRTYSEVTMSAAANIAVTTTELFPYGNNAVLSASQRRDLIVIPRNNLLSTNTITSVSLANNSSTISASGLSDKLRVGDRIYVYSNANAAANAYTSVSKVINSTAIQISNSWGYANAADGVVARYLPALIPIVLDDDRTSASINGNGKTLNISLSNTSGSLKFSGTSNVFVTYNVARYNAAPTTKSIKRNIKVKLCLANNAGGIEGPWNLGIPDAFLLNNVYIGNSSVNTSSTDIKRHFYINNGQNKDYYGHSQLLCVDKNLTGLTANDWLLVNFSVFDLPSASGGFFTVDSYTQSTNNANVAVLGNNYVFGAEIPDFSDVTDEVFDMIDCVDFRPRVQAVANIQSSVGSATINPANTISFGSYDKLFPAPESLVSFNSSFYLSRKDRVVIDEESNITVLEGRPSINAQIPPDEPHNTMTIGILNVAPYPSSPRVPDNNIVYLASKRVGGTKGPIYQKVIDYTVTEDLIQKKKTIQPRRYTMADIGKLERRIEDLEYYTNLNLLEKSVADLNLPSDIDPSKNRFKNGFVVDNFNDYGRSLQNDPEFTCIIEQKASALFPSALPYNLHAKFNTANNLTLTNLRQNDTVGYLDLNRHSESVLLLPANGTANVVVQDKFTSLVSGLGSVQFVGDMSIAPANMKVLLKAELYIPGDAPPPVPVTPPAPVVTPTPPAAALYSIVPSTTYCNEGDTVVFNITVTNVPSGTTLYWTTNGTANANDFVDGQMSGSVVVSNTSATVSRAIKNDNVTEGIETFYLELRVSSIAGDIKATSETVRIIDTSLNPVPTYNITPNKYSVDEGNSVVFSVTTTNVNDGTTLYWTTDGTANSSDFADSYLTGNVTITSGSGTITRNISNDTLTEGPENFALKLRTTSISGNVVAISNSVVITDTSLTPPPVYTITPNTSSVNEGSSVAFAVTVANAPDGTYYWSTAGTVNANDFVSNTTTGTVTVASGTGTVTRALASDLTTEGTEYFTLSLRQGSVSGNVLAVSSSVNVNDTSITPAPVYSIVPNVSTVNEGNTVTFAVTVQNSSDGTYYWNTTGAVSAADFSSNTLSGTVTVTSGSGSISRTLVVDNLVEKDEPFSLQLLANSVNGTVLAVSSSVVVVDKTPIYLIKPNKTTVPEGNTVTFSVNITNDVDGTYYWSTSGTVSANDFTSNTLTGTVTIANGAGSIVRDIANDILMEGEEYFTLSLRQGSISGNVLATSRSVTVSDTTVGYSIVPNKTSSNEGESVTFTVTITNGSDGTYYWSTETPSGANGVNVNDFSDSVTTGSISVIDGTATITRTTVIDTLVEGTESYTIALRSGSTSGTILAVSEKVDVLDVPPVPTYTIRPDVTSVNEGGTITYSVEIKYAPKSTYYWTAEGSGISSSDFVDGNMYGAINLTQNTYVGTITRIISNDYTTEGNEVLTLSLRESSNTGNVVAVSAGVTINDTSLSPTYSITPDSTSIDEGGTVTYTVTTTSVPNSTVLYYTLSGTAGSSDLTEPVKFSGQVTIANNNATFNITALADQLTEGTENIIAQLRTGSLSGTIVATAPSVNIRDTSTTPPPSYSITPSVSGLNEGQSVTFNVSTTNVTNGTTLYWTLTGSTGFDTNDVSTSSGSVVITNNSASFNVAVVADNLTDPGESFSAQLRTNSTSGTVVATSSAVNISDTSTTPVPTYKIAPNVTTVNELTPGRLGSVIAGINIGGGSPYTRTSVTFTVTTTNITNGTVLNYNLIGTGSHPANAADFTSPVTGNIVINNNTGSFVIGINPDFITEWGSEFFAAQLLNGSSLVATSATVTIIDNSNVSADRYFGLQPPPPPPRPYGTIMCAYLAEKGEIPAELGRADQMFGQILKRKHPIAYRGYLYYATYNLAALEGKTDVSPFPFNFIKSPSVRSKFNFYSSNLFMTLLKSNFIDASEHMAYVVGVNKEDNKVGKINMVLFKILSRIVGLFVKNANPSFTTTRATVALATTIIYTIYYIATKNVFSLGDKVKNIFRKNK